MYAHAPCTCIAYQGQKRAMYSLELELQINGNCFVDAGNQTFIAYGLGIIS